MSLAFSYSTILNDIDPLKKLVPNANCIYSTLPQFAPSFNAEALSFSDAQLQAALKVYNTNCFRRLPVLRQSIKLVLF